MIFYTYFRSSASFRVRIAINLKKISPEQLFISLPDNEHNAAFKDINPQGLLPTIKDGDFTLSQSLAIINYLDASHPQPAFYPEDEQAKAVVSSMAQVIACDIHPLNNLRVLKYLKSELGHDQDTVNKWYAHWVCEGFQALEELVGQYGNTYYCFGDNITLADICLVPQIWNAKRFNVNLDAFDRLTKIYGHLTSLSAFQQALPENQPDAF